MTRRFNTRVKTAFLVFLSTFIWAIFPSYAQSKPFIVKPYIQLGNNPKIEKNDNLEIVWSSGDKGDSWQLYFRQKESDNQNNKWINSAIKSRWQGNFKNQEFFQHIANVTGIEAGRQFEYKLSFKNQEIFKSTGTMRKSCEQPYTFAVFGDVGAGSSGQKKNAFQCLKEKPDFYLIPGDIVYDRGLVSEYLRRFFPIMNADIASKKTGAPLLRSTLTITAIGNHDIALSSKWSGINFTSYPDALGYYTFWSQPLNGPQSLINGKNTTRIKGDPQTQLNFVRAAQERFPRMANFSFDYGNSHWLVLDANPYMDWTDKKTRAWVEEDLKKARSAVWKFVLCHQPGFTIDHSHWVEQRMRLLSDIFEKHGVTMVFSGHAHTYQRSFPMKFKCKLVDGQKVLNDDDTVDGEFVFDKNFDGKEITKPDGVIYIVSGAGGASLYRKGALNKEQSSFNDKFFSHKHSFTICKVEGEKFSLKQISCDGEELDQITITKK